MINFLCSLNIKKYLNLNELQTSSWKFLFEKSVLLLASQRQIEPEKLFSFDFNKIRGRVDCTSHCATFIRHFTANWFANFTDIANLVSFFKKNPRVEAFQSPWVRHSLQSRLHFHRFLKTLKKWIKHKFRFCLPTSLALLGEH